MKRVPKKHQEMHTSSELQRYLGVIHEEHMEAIKAMGERFVDMDRRFDGIDKKFDTIDNRFDGIDKKLDSHTEMIVEIAEDLEVVKSDVEVIKSDIGIIKTDLKQKVDRTEFATLERRVFHLESKVR